MQVDGYILLQASTHGDALRLRFEDWYRLVKPQVGEFCEPTDCLQDAIPGQGEVNSWTLF